MNGVIIYKSVYGSTKQYAEWIQEETLFDIIRFEDVKPEDLGRYTTIVIGTPVIASKPFLARWIVENYDALSHAEIVLFSCSASPPPSATLQRGFEGSLPESMRERISYVQLHGRYDYSKLTLLHKLMMRIGAWIQKDKRVKAEMKRDLHRVVDGVDRNTVAAVVDAVRKVTAGNMGGVRT